MTSLALALALLSLAILAPSVACALFDLADTLVSEWVTVRPRDYTEWEILEDDSIGAWPIELTRPNGADFSPPIHFTEFLATMDAPREDLDALPAIAVAQRLLDVRRELFGAADSVDESLFLIEATCFLGAAGHGAPRARSQETERATPCAGLYPRATIQTSAPVSPYDETVCA